MKPDWKDAPEWAAYLAQDFNCEWWFYEVEPQPIGLNWVVDGRCKKAMVPGDNHYWTDTLEARP